MQQSPAISHAFNYVCQILHCNKSAEQYQLLYIEKVKLRKIGTEHTQLSGVLINQNNKSIELPNLKLSFGKETDQEEIILPLNNTWSKTYGVFNAFRPIHLLDSKLS